jgi:hypothetical protein
MRSFSLKACARVSTATKCGIGIRSQLPKRAAGFTLCIDSTDAYILEQVIVQVS